MDWHAAIAVLNILLSCFYSSAHYSIITMDLHADLAVLIALLLQWTCILL